MNEIKINQNLDLRGVTCPGNFVRVKLKLEEMQAGEILQILLDSGEPIKNVPRAIKEEGHQILGVQEIEGYWKLLIKKQR